MAAAHDTRHGWMIFGTEAEIGSDSDGKRDWLTLVWNGYTAAAHQIVLYNIEDGVAVEILRVTAGADSGPGLEYSLFQTIENLRIVVESGRVYARYD